jgi:pullulanase
MLSGEEFGRTKQGVKNSYRSPLSINAMDWQRSLKNAALTDYYRGLIALRKRLPALTDKSANAGDRLICVRQLAQDAAALLLDNGPDSTWSQLVLAVNASENPVGLNLPAGEWAVLADGESSFLWQKPACLSGRATIQPMSAMYLGLTK